MTKRREQNIIVVLSLLTTSFFSLVGVFKSFAALFALLGSITLFTAIVIAFKVFASQHDRRSTLWMALLGVVIFAVGFGIMYLINM